MLKNFLGKISDFKQQIIEKTKGDPVSLLNNVFIN
jgi:hypothetical protein